MKTISLVIPTYNEEKRIKKTINALKKQANIFTDIKIKEIIFSDDGSTDNTVKILKRAKYLIEKETKIKVIILNYNKNKGRGFAIKNAAKIFTADYLLYLDADFSIPLINLKNFIPYIKKDYDVIIGSKKIKGAKELVKRSIVRKIVGYSHSLISFLILGVFVWDFQGGFKLFSRKFVENVFPYLKINRWGFDTEVIFLAKKLNYKLKEIPVTWMPDENNSKVRLFNDILTTFFELIKIKILWISGSYQRNISPKLAFNY